NLGLVTYDRTTNSAGAENGFRLLRTNEYNYQTFDFGGNVWITNGMYGSTNLGGTVTIASNTVIHSLVYQKTSTNSAATTLQLGTNLLTIESGALLAIGNSAGATHQILRQTVGGVSGGLTFGNASNGYEAVITTARRLDVYAPIHDNIDALGVTNKVTLIKSGTGELIMRADGGGLSTYSGDTYINAGTLRMEGTNTTAFSTKSVIPTNTYVHIYNRDATFDLYNSGQIVGSIDGWGRVLGSSGSRNTNDFVVNYTNTSVIDRFDGWIQDGGGTNAAILNVVKRGAGTLEFTTLNQTNVYRGSTTIEGGTLLMNGIHIMTTNAANYFVRDTATLAGTGLVRIGGSFTFDDGATLAPGSGAPGTLTLDGNLSLSSNSVLAFELNGGNTAVDGGINDLVAGVNNLYLDGILDITALASFAGATTNDFWTLMTYDGSLTTNLLDISASSQSLLSGGLSFAIDDSFTGQIRLTIIPEPQSWALIAFGLGIVTWLARRRRV
ncbi:MAG TPA: autotransporter-associated beta strand repeat-containing protein, partial [Verrucomicrobiae bacterium]|nr:autotransporter-associated beta strand repeat-containing protein [Verrucomicrobiae bacterium]